MDAPAQGEHVNRISVVLIVKNEEVLITRCLESVKETDEIVIVDTGSTDKTMDVVDQWHQSLVDQMGRAPVLVTGFFQWCDHFAKARNYAKALASGDWILTIDADEYLDCPFALVREASLQAFLAANVKMPSESNPGTIHYFPKLFKNSQSIEWVGAIHNHLTVNGEDVRSTPTIVYGYSPAHAQDPNRSLRILEREVATRRDAVREMFYLGREYVYKRDWERCVITLGRYVQLSEAPFERAEAFLTMSQAYLAMNMWSDARDTCVQALIINPHFREACYQMAVLSGLGTDNPRWQANAEQWLVMARAADNRNVAFIRSIPALDEPKLELVRA